MIFYEKQFLRIDDSGHLRSEAWLEIPGGALSGGEQQVLTLARTLIGNPKLILIDEPSEGLSPFMVKLIFDTIVDLHQEGMSIVLVDQNLYFTCNISQRVYIMSKGRIVHSGIGKEVLNDREIQGKYLAV